MTFAPTSSAHETIGTDALRRIRWPEVALWCGAFVIVLTAQAIAAYTIATWSPSTPEPLGAPPPAIMIELSEISVAPQVEDIAAENGELTPMSEAAQPSEPVPAEELPEPVEEPVEEVVQEVAEAILPEPLPDVVPEPVKEVQPTETEPVEPVETEPPPDLEPEETAELEPLPEPEPVEEIIPDVLEAEAADVFVPMPIQMPTSLQEKRQEFAELQQQKEQDRKAEAAKKKKAEEAQQKKKKAAQDAKVASQQKAPQSVDAEQADKPAAAQNNTTTKRVKQVSPQQWQSRVNALIQRAKRYPSTAQKRGEQGIPQVQFVMDRSGRVLSVRVVRSSGFPTLDQAAVDTINRASPFPAPPDSISGNQIPLTVPINFNLRGR